MKMNRFRVILHPAFFGIDSGSGYVEKKYDLGKDMEKKQATDESKGEQNEMVDTEIFNDPDLSNIEMIIQEERQNAAIERNEGDTFGWNLQTFIKRCREKNSNGLPYKVVWERKIKEGFGFLKTTLKEKGYFDRTDAKKEEDIKKMYLDKVKTQYTNIIWYGGDGKFNKNKDTLFGRDSSEKYPANEVYKKLTGATTIFDRDTSRVEGHTSTFVTETKESATDTMENLGDKKNRKFLSNDVPQYLWNIKTKRTQNIPSGLQTVINILPIFNISQVRNSKEDRKQIDKFLKVSEKIQLSPNQANKDKAIALLECFNDGVKPNDGEDVYKQKLAEHGITVEKKYIDDIVRAGSFYLSTQSLDNGLEDQHPIYLSILKIIQNEGGVNQAVNKWKSTVEDAKENEHVEKKRGYKEGERLRNTNHELHDFAVQLGITDFTHATRLAEKPAQYFKSTSVENIIANISNDNTIDARDNVIAGSKTGSQFLEVFRQVSQTVGRERAMSNLAERVNFESKILGVTLPKYSAETMEADIKGGHTGLILLLQKIISKPGEDLLKLLSKDSSKDPFEGVDTDEMIEANKRAKEKAKELISQMNTVGLEEDGLTLPTPESMQSGLATSLYSEYKRGIGLGGKLSFDEWINGLEMNTGIHRSDETVTIGIGLDYHKLVNLGKGWTMTPELSAGAYIPIGSKTFGSVGLAMEFAKHWMTEEGTKHKLGLKGGVTVANWIPVESVGLEWEDNKLGGLEEVEQQKKEFGNVIIESVLQSLVTDGYSKLDFNNETKINDKNIVNNLKTHLREKAKAYGVKQEEIEKTVNETARLLAAYNNADISKESVRKVIAENVADQYAKAWAETRKAKVSEHAYGSGAGVGVFWATGTPLAGIYANIRRQDYDLDAYGDVWGKRQEISGKSDGDLSAENIDSFNRTLQLPDNEKLGFYGDFVVIPATTKSRVRINTKMKGLIKKDQYGNVFIRKETPISGIRSVGAAIQSTEIVVGGGTGKNFPKLNALKDDRFTDKDIDQNKVMALRDNVENFNVETLNTVLKDLKEKFPNDQALQAFEFDGNAQETKDLVEEFKQLITAGKGLKIKLDLDSATQKIKVDSSEEILDKNLTIEYKTVLPDLLDETAKAISEAVYKKALSLPNPDILWTVKHGKGWAEYHNFVKNMNNGNYSAAKGNIEQIFTELDDQYSKKYKNKPDFKSILTQLNSIQNENVLGQVLMSIRNVFARTRDVLSGSDGEYHFTRNLGDIINRRAGRVGVGGIADTLNKNINDLGAKTAYLNLIDAAGQYIQKHPDDFNVKKAQAKQLGNTVGFNLGDKKDPENPLFNPDIYNTGVEMDSLVGLGKFDENQKNTLHERAMTQFAQNKTLLTPILKTLGLSENATVKVKPGSFNNGKITLDILEENDKKTTVTLSSKLNFGFFTQCVNHTIILSDISATTGDGTIATFESGARKGNQYREGEDNYMTASTSTSFGIAVSIGGGGGEGGEDSGIKTEGGTSSTELPSSTPSGGKPIGTNNGNTAGDGSPTNSSFSGF